MKRLYWQQVTIGSTHVGENQVEVATVAEVRAGNKVGNNKRTGIQILSDQMVRF